MKSIQALLAALLLCTAPALAYPGGTPGFQTDVAPFCASCHSSATVDVLAGAPPGMAEKSLIENNHLAVIEAGEGGYGKLSEGDRKQLVDHIRALDKASTVAVEAPASVSAGQVFEVTVKVTGGSGPVVGVALVDAAHRWHARPAPSAGFAIAAPPVIVGPDGTSQTEWLSRRPAASGRNLSYVNVAGIASDASKGEYASASVTFSVRAPASPGAHALTAAYWYGTEKGSPLGYTEDPIRGKKIRGGFGGHSGRVVFATPVSVTVK